MHDATRACLFIFFKKNKLIFQCAMESNRFRDPEIVIRARNRAAAPRIIRDGQTPSVLGSGLSRSSQSEESRSLTGMYGLSELAS
eukprot:SAG31_NODE_283_length_18512_cov_19.352414_18_plen_85_part_00